MDTLREFHDRHVAFIKDLYDEVANDAEYDMTPYLAMCRDDREEEIMVLLVDGGNPMDMAGLAVKIAKPDMICFACSIWQKDPETGTKRIGEGVMVLSETREEQLSTIFEVTRSPLPVLNEGKPGDMAEARVPLLYQPNHTEH